VIGHVRIESVLPWKGINPMNRMFIALIAVLVTCTVSSSAAFAQTNIVASVLASVAKTAADRTNAPKAPGATKVAVFNIGVVFSKYEKALAIKENMAKDMKMLQDEAKQLAQNLNVWQKALQGKDLAPGKKEQYEEKIIIARRRMEDLERQARAKIGKSGDNNLNVLWKDVREAVKTYATEHGIQLVISYGDPIDTGLIDVLPNITRKMQAMDQGGGVPFFMAPGVDISEGIVELLNRQYREKKAEPAEEEEGR
jgi:Skp family chaperone for outer membrane proteins